MCPSFRATRDERDSPRGRANALRLTLVGEAEGDTRHETRDTREKRRPLEERWVFDVMDLCLQCKACKTECPSNVDVAKLKAEFLHGYYGRKPRPPGHWFLANVHRLLPLGAALPLANWLAGRRPTRWMLSRFAGIDRRRSLPRLHGDHFRRWFARHRRRTRQQGKRVILFDDCFTTFNEPQVGRAAVRVLERAGYTVELAGGVCCGRALISKGYLPAARDLARAALPRLAARIADGTPILGLEPSCLLTLADEWPELVPGEAARRVAAAAELADVWLARQVPRLTLPSRQGRFLLHTHCHQKALRGPAGSATALRLLPGADVAVLDAGCCGMAGSFGYEKEHYDLSVQIANLELLPALRAEPDAAVVATGTSCRHQVLDLAGRRALHPLEVLAEALDGG
jgi:Fe-S oxidoreductase